MAYTFSVNNTPATGAVAIWTLINTLKTAGWTQIDSSDGTTRATNQVTGGASGTNGLGNNSAWVRLRSPTTNGGSVVDQTREFIFHRGTDDRSWRIKYSASATFAGGVQAPTVTLTPDATDELVMIGTGTNASPGFLAAWLPVNGTYRWHVAAGGSAEFYSFYGFCMISGTASATGSVGMFLDVMATGSFPSNDVDPAVVYCSNTTGSGVPYGEAGLFGATAPSAVTNVTSPCKARAWLGATSFVGVSTSGTNNVGVALVSYGTCIGNTSTLGANPFTNKDDLLPAWWARPGFSVPPLGLKGCSTLFLYGSVVRTPMDTTDSPNTKDRIFVGGSNSLGASLWQPWSGVLPTI